MITACVVAYNEEAVIGRCLDSVAGAVDEVLVVHDGPCSDRTLDIAREAGARVFERPHAGHAEAHRPFSYEQARGEWILNLDADEFLSPELRAALPELARRDDVNAFEFVWKLWNGERYVTENGPHKRALMRRSAIHMLGLLQAPDRVDGRVERTSLHLEHRPLYNNLALRTIATKWRRWARIQARELLSDFSAIPKFNWPETDWPLRRRVLNALSPLLALPYGLATFAVMLRRQAGGMPPLLNLKLSAAIGAYNAMVQLYVARYLYLGGRG